MTTAPVVTITDELLAELEEECALAAELDINAAVVPAHITALLAHITDLKQQLVAAGITAENCELFRKDAERYRWLRDTAPSLVIPGPLIAMCNSDGSVMRCEHGSEMLLSRESADAAIDAARSTTDNTTEQPT